MNRCFLCGEEAVELTVDFNYQELYPEDEYEGNVWIYSCKSCGADYEVSTIEDCDYC